MFKKKLVNLNMLEKPERKKYYAALIHINVNDFCSDIYQDTVNKCFTLIQKHEGDVNQFLGGIILALWGVPFYFNADKERSINFFYELRGSGLSVSAILIDDIGFYGSFGNEKRLTVTAISDNVSNALKKIINCDNETFINNVV